MSKFYNNNIIIFLILVLTLNFLAKPTISTSRKVLETRIGFRVKLKHVDHGSNTTKLERIQRGIKRANERIQRFHTEVLATDTSTYSVETSVRPGNGEFLMDIGIGTPVNHFSAIMDTGSDLIWTQCKPCHECYSQPTPVFEPTKSSTYTELACSSELCKVLPTSACGDDGCEYMYTYGDYSSTQGVLAMETFTFGSGDGSSDEVSVPNIGFGCGQDNEGSGFDQGGGLVGLGRGPLSLVSQLDEPKFSYCLTSMDDDSKTSTLLMGSLADTNMNANQKGESNIIITTKLVKNPSQPSFYYLDLQGISVGPTRLLLEEGTFALKEDGSGGMIIDSGTTITYLEQTAFDQVKKEFKSQISLPVKDSGSSTGLDLCFKMAKDTSSVEVPKLVFHFKEGDLELPSENYLIGDSNMGLLCLAMGASNGMSIFGNVQQQNIMVVHDLAKETLSFVPTQCDEL